jgi:hypothetical protein
LCALLSLTLPIRRQLGEVKYLQWPLFLFCFVLKIHLVLIKHWTSFYKDPSRYLLRF